MIVEILLDAVKDSVILIPFLFLTYLVLEAVEAHASEKMVSLVGSERWFDPILGALLGVVPECGFSAAAASLFSGGAVTIGTLVAVFLATSDEMLPIFISENVPVSFIVRVLAVKVAIAAIVGVALNLLFTRRHKSLENTEERIEELCENSHCACTEHEGIVKPALIHTAEIVVFVLIVNLVLNTLVELGGEAVLEKLALGNPVLSCMVTALVGLIPNCAVSVAITELYLNGALSLSAMLSGLLTGSGVGMLVLFRTNRHGKENFMILGIVYVCGVLGGLTAGLLF
ncbi:MAG: arsenic efflux protein [Oscillospiraceae bacterium]|nr:arsenic efflux protein [Oscillospiraceae bacterium]MDD6503721.1 putative manganese transporter [Oscillospiraceae bacterium]MDY4104338.1 putative manganese transporter [Oscillospiraceae bacterium]